MFTRKLPKTTRSFLLQHPLNQNTQPLLIAGGGIGGLTAALFLARAGFAVEVFEQAEGISEIGAGLQLSPNAMRAFDGLGLTNQLEDIAGKPKMLQIYSAVSGQGLAKMPLGIAAKERWGAPYYVAHRFDLQSALYDACCTARNIRIHFGCTAQGFNSKNGIILSVLKKGVIENISGIGIIGADGLWSKIRAQLLNDGLPHASGFAAYRTLIKKQDLPPSLSSSSSTLWLGPDLHVVHYPLKGHELINIVAIVRESLQRRDWNLEAKPDHLFKVAEDCAQLLKDLLYIPQNWTRWALCDRPANEKPWPRGNVTLLGDAAHPMLPFLAQGAAQAIEDATVLANCVEKHNSIANAFFVYRKHRALRTAALTREAERNGRIFHLSGIQAKARDFVLRLMSGERLMQRYDWVYGKA
jgi:salicylate hydroxylase